MSNTQTTTITPQAARFIYNSPASIHEAQRDGYRVLYDRALRPYVLITNQPQTL